MKAKYTLSLKIAIAATLCLSLFFATETTQAGTTKQEQTADYLIIMLSKTGEIEYNKGSYVLVLKYQDAQHMEIYKNNPLQLVKYISKEDLTKFWHSGADDFDITPPRVIVVVGDQIQTAKLRKTTVTRDEIRYTLAEDDGRLFPHIEAEPASIAILLPKKKLDWWCSILLRC